MKVESELDVLRESCHRQQKEVPACVPPFSRSPIILRSPPFPFPDGTRVHVQLEILQQTKEALQAQLLQAHDAKMALEHQLRDLAAANLDLARSKADIQEVCVCGCMCARTHIIYVFFGVLFKQVHEDGKC